MARPLRFDEGFAKMSLPNFKPILIALLATALLAGCGKQPEPAKAPEANKSAKEEQSDATLRLSAEERQKAGIATQLLFETESPEQVVVTATILANQDKLAHVAPRVAGRIVKVSANLGDRVKAGQLLALLDSIELGEARSAYLQAASEAAVAKAAFERATQLQAENIIAGKEYLRARSEHEKAQASLRAASGKLSMLGAGTGRDDGSVFTLTAPFAGTVIEKHAILGELREPDESAFTIADLSTLWIEVDLYEKDLAKVKQGARALVTLAAYPGEVFKGKLTYVSSVMDKETRTVKARVEVPNPDDRLKPEMFATAAIDTGKAVKDLRLPEDAVLLLQGQPTVFVAEKDGFEPRAVETGERAQGMVVLKSGVAAGERVAVKGAYALKARLLKSQIGDAD